MKDDIIQMFINYFGGVDHVPENIRVKLQLCDDVENAMNLVCMGSINYADYMQDEIDELRESFSKTPNVLTKVKQVYNKRAPMTIHDWYIEFVEKDN